MRPTQHDRLPFSVFLLDRKETTERLNRVAREELNECSLHLISQIKHRNNTYNERSNKTDNLFNSNVVFSELITPYSNLYHTPCKNEFDALYLS